MLCFIIQFKTIHKLYHYLTNFDKLNYDYLHSIIMTKVVNIKLTIFNNYVTKHKFISI